MTELVICKHGVSMILEENLRAHIIFMIFYALYSLDDASQKLGSLPSPIIKPETSALL